MHSKDRSHLVGATGKAGNGKRETGNGNGKRERENANIVLGGVPSSLPGRFAGRKT